MKVLCLLALLAVGPVSSAAGQVAPVPGRPGGRPDSARLKPTVPGAIDPVSGRRIPLLTAEDTAGFLGRTRPARSPFTDCISNAFETCASEAIEARLSQDGLQYGVLITRQHDRFRMFVWRFPPKPGSFGGGGGGGGRGGRGRGRGAGQGGG